MAAKKVKSKDKGNPYKLFPRCPKCEKIGPIVAKEIRQCLTETCDVKLYWYGGFALRGGTGSDTFEFEAGLHTSKENIFGRALKKKLHAKKEDIMSDTLKRYVKKK